MRLPLILSALIPLAFLAGCGVTMQDNAASPAGLAMTGKVFGGQAPIVGATISVYSYGTSGYGSAGALLGTTTTDSNGAFSVPAYTCPTATASTTDQIYILSIGGVPGGIGTNPAAVLGAALGSCSAAQSSSVTINEVTTTAMAFALAHFFTPSYGSGSADSFGTDIAVGGASNHPGNLAGLALANETAHDMVNVNYGGVSTIPGGAIDSSRVYGVANILASCVNSKYTTDPNQTVTGACGTLFTDTTNTGASGTSGVTPSDILQSAVQIALNPSKKVAALVSLVPPEPAFSGGFTSTPYDFSIGMSYTTASLGLAVPENAIPTIDIDGFNRVWFASNAPGAAGLAYFDPDTKSFYGPYNNTSIVEPLQVAIDNHNYVWAVDLASSVLSGYQVLSPTAAVGTYPTGNLAFTLPGYNSTALTIDDDNSVNVGVAQCASGVSCPGTIAQVPNTDDSYALLAGVTGALNYPATSLGAGADLGEAITTTSVGKPAPHLYGYYLNEDSSLATPPIGAISQEFTSKEDAGQVIFTGNDFVTPRPYSGTGSGSATDGLCIFSQQACYAFSGAGSSSGVFGAAVDGAGTLWFTGAGNYPASSLGPQVFEAPIVTPGSSGAEYLTGSKVDVLAFPHGPNYGGTLVQPYAIAIDAAGNVWVANAGCVSTSGTLCTPGSFTLSELVGAAAPTYTPVSCGIDCGYYGGNVATGTEP